MRFGQLEIGIIAAAIRERFTLERLPGHELEIRQTPTLGPRGGLPKRQWFVVRSTVGPARPAADAFVAFLGSAAARQVLGRVLEMR